MFRQHDYNRVDTGIMFGTAGRADPGPAAAIGLGDMTAHRAMSMTPVPVGKAQGGSECRRFRRGDKGQQLEMGAGVYCRSAIWQV